MVLLASDSHFIGVDSCCIITSRSHKIYFSHAHMQMNMKGVFARLTWQQPPNCPTWLKKFLFRAAIFSTFTAGFLAVRLKLNQGMPKFTP